MYAIGNVIYGHDLQPICSDNDEFVEFVEDIAHNSGCLSYYSGHSVPLAFGIEMDCMDECGTVYFSELKTTPTEEQKRQYDDYKKNVLEQLKSVDEQDQDLARLLEEALNNEPSVFIMWSTS